MYATAQSSGWFIPKINYATALNDFEKLKIGDPVKIMGFPAGEITGNSLNSPEKPRGIRVFFSIREPYYYYIWYDSSLAVKSDLLGNRYLEVSKGQWGVPTVSTNFDKGKMLVLLRYKARAEYLSLTNELRAKVENKSLSDQEILVLATNQLMSYISNHVALFYTNASAGKFKNYPPDTDPDLPREKQNYCFIPALDTPALEDRLAAVATQVEAAVPNILAMTNQLAAVLSNANNAVARMDRVLAEAEPIMTNVNTITANLRDPNGSLGNWIIPTSLVYQLHQTLHSATEALTSAHSALDDTDTNVTRLTTDLDKSLENLANLTSNLNAQVQANSNVLSQISVAVVHTDELVQGLKREWFLRGAFKTKKPKKDNSTNAPEPLHRR